MAVTPLAELQRQQRGAVPTLSDLQNEQQAEVEAGLRDPVLGAFVPVRIEDHAWSVKSQLRDRIMRNQFPGQDAEDIFGPGDPLSDRYWGRIVDRVEQMDEQGKLQQYYQAELGFSPQMAVGRTDAISEALFGKKVDYKTAWGYIKDAYRTGQIQVQLSDLGLDVLMGRDTAATWQEIERLRKSLGTQTITTEKWWTGFVSSTAEQLPLMGETIEAAPVGAVAGGAAGLVSGLAMGAASPTIGEESMIPAMVWGGMKTGAGLAGAARVGQLEAGGALLDMLDAGVDPAVAKAACVGVGVLNGALELGQISTLVKTLPGGRQLAATLTGDVVKKMVQAQTLRGLALRHSARFGGYLGAETLQELAQESVSLTAEETAKLLTEALGGDATAIEYATIEQIKQRMIEVGTKSLELFTVLGIPGSALSVGVDAVQMRRQSAAMRLLPDGRQTQVLVRVPTADQSTTETQRAQRPAEEIGQAPPAAANEGGQSAEAMTPATTGPAQLEALTPDATGGTMPAMAEPEGVGREEQQPPTPQRPGGTYDSLSRRFGVTWQDASGNVRREVAAAETAMRAIVANYGLSRDDAWASHQAFFYLSLYDTDIAEGRVVPTYDDFLRQVVKREAQQRWAAVRSQLAKDARPRINKALADAEAELNVRVLTGRTLGDWDLDADLVPMVSDDPYAEAPANDIYTWKRGNKKLTQVAGSGNAAVWAEETGVMATARFVEQDISDDRNAQDLWAELSRRREEIVNRELGPEPDDTMTFEQALSLEKRSFNPSPRSQSAGTDSGKLPGGRQSGGTILFSPEEWIRVVREARKLFAEGADQFGQWSELMIASAGEEIRPALKQLWELAVNPTIEPEQVPVPAPSASPASSAVQATLSEEQAILQGLNDLSYEALAEKAKEIGLTVRGKKAQLAALIAEAIKAKAGPEVRRMAKRTVKGTGTDRGQKVQKLVPVVTTRIADKKALADVERQIKDYPAYRAFAEGAGATGPDLGANALDVGVRSARVDPERVYYVEPKYKGEVEGFVGKRGAKGYNGKLAAHLTFDRDQGQAWDQAMQEQGLDLDFSGFMSGLADSLAAMEKGPGGINEAALREAVASGDPAMIMLAEKRAMLRAGRSAYDVNKALEKLGADLGVERELWEDMLIGSGMLLDPDDPHPGSLGINEFRRRLGQELGEPDSEWIRRWELPGVPETPAAWHRRLKAEWDAIQATGIAAELNVGQILATATPLTEEQEAQINAIDAEKVAEEIVQREKQTMFARLLEGFFEESAILGQLRTALRQAYRAGADEGIAKARDAYRAQRQKMKAQKELREYVATLLREIKRPVGKTVAFVQRQAIEAIQREIDPVFRSKRTMAEREASRRFFAEHPEYQAPAKVLALVQRKSPGEMTVTEIEQAAQAVREIRRKGKILRARENTARADRLQEDIADVVASIDAAPPEGWDPAKPIVRRPEETKKDRWWSFYVSTLTPERVFDWLDRGKDYLGKVFTIFWERVADAESAKLVWIRQRTAATVEILERLKLTYQDLQAEAMTIQGEEFTVEMCIGVYNFMKNVNSRLAITFGNNLTPASHETIRQYVEDQRPELKELADWIVEHYEEHYERLRQAVIEAEDRDMGREAYYTPMRRLEADYTTDERQILDEMMTRHHFKRGYADKGMTLLRKDIAPEFQKPIRLDAWTVLLEQIERQEHYIHLAKMVKDLHAVVNDDGVKEAVRRRGGQEMWKALQSYVDAVGNPNIYKTYGQVERWLRRLRRNTAIAFLAWKVSTILKQPVSMVRYLPHAGMHLLQAGLEAASDWAKVRELVVGKDPLVEQPALERELEELKAADAKGYQELVDKVGKTGMQGIVWMDGIARTIGWYGTYLHEIAKGSTEEQAVKRARLATSTSQAGARVFQLPELYRTNQEGLLALMQFTNELNKLWNIATYDLPTLMKNHQWERAAGTFVAVGIEATLMWMIANRAMPKDDQDGLEIVGDQLVGAIPIVGPVIVSTAHGFGGQGVPAWEGGAQAVVTLRQVALEGLRGETDDEKILDAAHKIYKGLAPWAGVPYTGPRDIARTILFNDFAYLLGTPPKRRGSGSGRVRGRGRARAGRRR